jgi:large-conductance mechanosensitive channel
VEKRPASSLFAQKLGIKEFGSCIKYLCDFLKVAILVFLAIWQMDGFQRGAPS